MSGIARLSRTTTCRGCGKPIAFIKSVSGKSIPVDPEPIYFIPEDEKHKFVLMDGTVKRGSPVESDETGGTKIAEIGYRSHWSTCPAAEDFRRKKNKSERTRKDERFTAEH